MRGICGRRGSGAVFSENDIFAVIHFAGMKAGGESVRQPLAYYENNVTGTIRLLRRWFGTK